jgi:hypothetical protein
MSAKDLVLKPVSRDKANRFIERHHYSGTTVEYSHLHLGVYYNGSMVGALQYGDPVHREKIVGLVDGTGWNEVMELNRMALTDDAPQNSASRSLAVSIKMFEKHAPHVKWIISYADAAQCGDGSIYRAANFVLTGIKKNEDLLRLKNGDVRSGLGMTTNAKNSPVEAWDGKTPVEVCGGSPSKKKIVENTDAEPIPGYQLRYMYFIDDDYRENLTVPEIPYERIDEVGAGMYKGEKISVEERKP